MKLTRHPLLRLLWCLIDAGAGITLALLVSDLPHAHFLLASPPSLNWGGRESQGE